MSAIAPSDHAATMEQRIPTSSQRPQAHIVLALDVHAEADYLQLVGSISDPGERAQILRTPAGSHSQFVEQNAQEAIQFAQAIADDLGLMASLDQRTSRTSKAGTEEPGSIQQGLIRLFNTDGGSLDDCGSLGEDPLPTTTRKDRPSPWATPVT